MDHLAKAVVTAAAYLEFVDDRTLDPHDAVRALEDIANSLQGASGEEIEALRSAAAAEREAHVRLGANPQVLEFFDRFVYNVGLVDAPE